MAAHAQMHAAFEMKCLARCALRPGLRPIVLLETMGMCDPNSTWVAQIAFDDVQALCISGSVTSDPRD